MIIIWIWSRPRFTPLSRSREDESCSLFEVEARERWTVGIAYFGLIALLALGMTLSHVRS